VTVRANAVVVTVTISIIADLIGGSGNTGKTPANTLAPPLRVYVTVSCPSVRLSVPSFDHSSGVGGWLLRAMRHEGRRYSLTLASVGHPAATAPQHGAQQQMRAVPC